MSSYPELGSTEFLHYRIIQIKLPGNEILTFSYLAYKFKNTCCIQ